MSFDLLFPMESVSFFWKKRFDQIILRLKYFLVFIFLFFSSFTINAKTLLSENFIELPKLVNEILLNEKVEIKSFISFEMFSTIWILVKSDENSSGNNMARDEIITKALYIILLIIMLAGLILVIYRYRNKKNTPPHRNDIDLVNNIHISQNNKKDWDNVLKEPVKNINFITDETSTAILKKLAKFENSDKYLRKDINLTWLANNLNTNTKYISEVIKIHRNKNFNNYINGLRIEYIIQKLSQNPVYREYKITYLAEECGYASPQVFVIAFKKESGVTPSYFIDQLKAESDDNYQESIS